MRSTPFVEPLGGGRYGLRVPPAIRQVIRTGVAEVRELVVVGDPSLQRLFPPAHPGEPELEAEWQAMMAGQLIEARLAAFDVVDETLDADEIDEAQLEGWLQGINAIRLVMGTIVGIDDDDEPTLPTQPSGGRDLGFIRSVYHVLGLVLEELVDAASTGLDERD